MPRNGSGTYSLPLADVVAGNTILASWANTTMDDIATAMTASLAKDGQTNPTANLPMNNYRHTGVGQAANRTDYARADQIVDGDLLYLTGVAGTNTITATGPLTMAAYVTGMFFNFKAAATNSGAVTLNINSIGAIAIRKKGTTALVSGDIVSGRMYQVVYDGTYFQLVNFDALQALTPTDSYFIVGNGTTWVTETGATVRTSLGLGTGNSPQFTGLTLTGNASITGTLGVTNTTTLTGTLVTRQGANVASSSNLTLGTGNLFTITGATTINSIASKGVGTIIVLRFSSSPTLTHHATNLILPTGANITAANGDVAVFYEYASADWRCISYTRADGTPLALGANTVTASQIATNAVDTAEIASGAVHRDEIATTTITLSGTVAGSSGTDILLGGYCFFPMIHVSNPSGLFMTGVGTDAANPDLGRFRIQANSKSGGSYDVDYRYISS